MKFGIKGSDILLIRLLVYYHLLILVVIDVLGVKFNFEQNKVEESLCPIMIKHLVFLK